MMALALALLHPPLRALRRRPRKRPLGARDDDLVDGKGDVQLDGVEDARVGRGERFGADRGWEVGRHDHSIGGVEGHGFGDFAVGEGGAVGVEEGGDFLGVGFGGRHWV